MQVNKRESNLDLLRILCCVAVVLIHVSSRFKVGLTDPMMFGELITDQALPILLADTLTRFAVPCFVMLAGAFALGNEDNAHYRSYYRKIFRSVGIPTLIFSLFYVLCSLMTQLRLVLAEQAAPAALLIPIKAWILGNPYYHMWYLYAMTGLYILTPVLIRWKNSVSLTTFRWSAVVLILLCTISGWTSQQKFYWDLGRMFCYTGYYVMGYVLRDLLSRKKHNGKALLCIGLALAAELVITWIQYRHSMQGLTESDEVYSLVGAFNPLIVLASVLMFSGFCMLSSSVNCGWFAKRSFLIYLFHAGVMGQLMGWVLQIDLAYCAATIPAAALVILAVSYGVSVAYEKLWAQLEKKWDISRRLTDWLLPEK